MTAYQSAAIDRFCFRVSMVMIWLVIIGLGLYAEGIIR
jgi:hypothetical protein